MCNINIYKINPPLSISPTFLLIHVIYMYVRKEKMYVILLPLKCIFIVKVLRKHCTDRNVGFGFYSYTHDN